MSYNLDTTEVLDELFEHLCRNLFPTMHSKEVKKVKDAIKEFGHITNPEWKFGEN